MPDEQRIAEKLKEAGAPTPDWVSGCGTVVLYQADCLKVLPELPELQSAVVVSDPPYGIAYKKGSGGKGCHSKQRRNIEAIHGDSEPFNPSHLLGFHCLLFGADHYSDKLPAGGMMHVWDKHCGRAGRDSFSDAELFWTSWTCKRQHFRYLWKGLQQEGQGEKRDHPTQKPVTLMEWCVGMTKQTNIIEPYLGSGTTGVAAARLDRQFIGIEIDENYFTIARDRIQKELTRMPLFDPPTPTQLPLPLGEQP